MTVEELAAGLAAAAERAGWQVRARSDAAGLVVTEVEFEITYVRTRQPPGGATAGTTADTTADIAVDTASVLAAPERERERLRFSVPCQTAQ
ncbi:hypothetical protein [Actinomadura sp. WMMB 499]|uniref:hypothetical protein n=1 Tax=Actinomadura sp. WMMB 499 TaxID=1219491 RepID=UPI001248F7DD|nr:hypothetical protein [Actinomadura sp. WMMB 499]QFG21246.1 hypothetical protein F7P10_08960 [Actinomadura sp. WMMB 499]